MTKESFIFPDNRNPKFVDMFFTTESGKFKQLSITSEEFSKQISDSTSIQVETNSENEELKHLHLIPDLSTITEEPFASLETSSILCYISSSTDSKTIASNADKFLLSTKIADKFELNVQIQYYTFDEVFSESKENHSSFEFDSYESMFSSNKKYGNVNVNLGHREKLNKDMLLCSRPIDSLGDSRAEICDILSNSNVTPLHHFHDANSGQNTISFRSYGVEATADAIQRCKYIIKNVVAGYGKTATFIPKPSIFSAGSGIIIKHNLLFKGKSLFENKDFAKSYEYGIRKNILSLLALNAPTLNSYKRLCKLEKNTSISESHVTTYFADATANPYIAIASQLLAGVSAISNTVDQIPNFDTTKFIPINTAEALRNNFEFLQIKQVFNENFINNYANKVHSDALDHISFISAQEFQKLYTI